MRPWLRWLFWGGAALGWAWLAWGVVAARVHGLPLDRPQTFLAVIACFVMILGTVERAIGKTDD